MRRAACWFLAFALFAPSPAAAIVGGAPASDEIAAETALIASTRGASCSSAVLARDLLLTSAHCVAPPSDYAAVVFEGAGPRLIPVARTALHPRFDADGFDAGRPSPDLALVKLASPLPVSFRPVRLHRDTKAPRAGDRFTLAGYGLTREGDGSSVGKLHALALPAIGNTIDKTGVIMVRLSAGGAANAGACIGDSGGPVYKESAVAAVIGWTIGHGARECGRVTGATLVAPQLGWIRDAARELGAQFGE